MPKMEPEQKIFAIVILGDFNPAIFHPSWLAQNELIPNEEVGDASDLICTNEVSTFVLNDVHFQVERQRFGLTTKNASNAPLLRDLAVGVFTLLEHTPLTAVGLNLDIRYSLGSKDAWHNVGDRLAPKGPWQSVLENPGMLGVSMQGKRPNCGSDCISVRVQPAPGIEYGVFVRINQHYAIETVTRSVISDRNQEVMRILNEDWFPFHAYAENAALTLVRDDGIIGERE